MQIICTLLRTDNLASTLNTQFSTCRMQFLTPNQQSQSAGGRRDEGPRSCAGPSAIVRSSRDIGGQGVPLSRPGHPAHPPSSDDRTGAHTGVQPDTVSAGFRSCSECRTLRRVSFCRVPDDHHLSHSSSSCIGSRFVNGLTTSWPSCYLEFINC